MLKIEKPTRGAPAAGRFTFKRSLSPGIPTGNTEPPVFKLPAAVLTIDSVALADPETVAKPRLLLKPASPVIPNLEPISLLNSSLATTIRDSMET